MGNVLRFQDHPGIMQKLFWETRHYDFKLNEQRLEVHRAYHKSGGLPPYAPGPAERSSLHAQCFMPSNTSAPSKSDCKSRLMSPVSLMHYLQATSTSFIYRL